MQKALLDFSIYVSALRRADTAVTIERFAAETDLWLSAVVLEELYAGARDPDRGILEEWERDFGRAGRVVVPNLNDWVGAGKILRGVAQKYDYEKIGRGRLTNDALIATSAARLGIQVITANAADFKKLAEFTTFSWQAAVI